MTGWRKRQVLDMAEKASPSKQDWWKDDDALEAFAELVSADEREACAKIADTEASKWGGFDSGFEASIDIADAIRAERNT
jgi:hypothetical protein